LVRHPAKTYDATFSAPGTRALVEDEHRLWLAATVSRVEGMAAPLAYSNVAYVPNPGRYLRLLPILLNYSDGTVEKRARRRSFLISWKHQ